MKTVHFPRLALVRGALLALGLLQYSQTQVTYNTDCCGISVQYRRFNFGSRYENQFRIAFAVANIGTFGTLKKQERMF